jgi:hypothetical protein
LCISGENKYIAVQLDELTVIFIDFLKIKYPREIRIAFNLNSKVKRILGITFAYSEFYDLIIVHTAGFEIYKYNSEKLQLKNVRSVILPIQNFWFEVTT